MKSKAFRLLRVGLLILLPPCYLASGTSALAQDVIVFYNHTSDLKTRVYLGGDHQIAGNGSNDYPPGARDWTGFTALLGTGYTAQLWYANGQNQPESSLQPVFPTTTFLTVAAGAGVVVNAGAVGLPGVPEGGIATMTMRVWDNQGGTITNWNAAVAAATSANSSTYGESPLFNSPPLSMTDLPAPSLVGLQSFNIYLHTVPEPSTLAMASLGAAALWIFCRRK